MLGEEKCRDLSAIFSDLLAILLRKLQENPRFAICDEDTVTLLRVPFFGTLNSWFGIGRRKKPNQPGWEGSESREPPLGFSQVTK